MDVEMILEDVYGRKRSMGIGKKKSTKRRKRGRSFNNQANRTAKSKH
jgi:hypothetical protein